MLILSSPSPNGDKQAGKLSAIIINFVGLPFSLGFPLENQLIFKCKDTDFCCCCFNKTLFHKILD